MADETTSGGEPADTGLGEGAGVGEGGESLEDLSLQDIADEFDAEAAAEAVATKTAEGGKEGAEGAPPPGVPDKLIRFINENYGGDYDRFLDSQYESRKQGKELTERIARLEGQLSASAPARDRTAEVRAAIDSNPEVQAVNHQLASIDAEVKRISTRQVEIADTHTRVTNDIAQLDAKLAHADDADRSKIFHDLMIAKTKLEALAGQFDSNASLLNAHAVTRGSLAREFNRHVRDIQEDLDSQSYRERNERTIHERVNRDFRQMYTHHVKDLNLEPDSPAARKLYDAVRKEVRLQLIERGPDGEVMDPTEMFEAIGASVKEMREAFSIRPRMRTGNAGGRNVAAASSRLGPVRARPVIPPPGLKQRLGVSGAGAGAGSTSRGGGESQTNAELMRDPEYVRRRAARVMEASTTRRRPT